MKKIKISPSLMCADFISLGRELDLMAGGGIDYLHIDIMDGRYVPNFTLGPDFCRSVAAHSRIPLDIHLMTETPEEHVPLFAGIPGVTVSFHPETSRHPLRTVEQIRSLGGRPGIAVDPALPASAVREILPHVSLVCVMTVNPGYAGQKLIPATLLKVREIADMTASAGWDLEIEVDGNVSWDNIPRMIEAGGEVLVAGTSSLYDGKADLGRNIERFLSLVGRRGAPRAG
ncbi:MAG TPA: ribulose-phosphate 3-epimerase [Spirochaetia bacterium]|nr:ribulose-phosphate 3-epimerase [Spirochaetia bacterium]